ncbi:VirD4-like conjugal transfer protein, CD1115 family, partial [Vibrio parahaemolyticus]|uniref:VirD4-like conjugal transfer protein, CD1115 family n=1 Tax=Vibrio parahaemolyticus TaxID=670 RepID=UPI003B67F2C1
EDPEAEIEEYNFAGLQKLINNSQVDENNPELENPVDEVFKEHEKLHGDSLAVSQYKKYRLASGKTAKSILISVGTRLAPFDLKEVRDLTEYDELKLEDIGDKKTIFYIIVSDTNSTFNFLAGMMYSQLFDLLTNRADNNPNHKLNYPVQMYLDEFANIGTIPDFEQKIATIRSRGISAVVILQSIDQLKSKYKDSANTIIDNCDTLVFLGGKGSTLKTVSETLGKETIDMLNNNTTKGSSESYTQNNSKAGRELMTADEIGTMDNSKCIVSIRGVRPFMSNKIELTKHKNYKLLSDDSEDGKSFDYVSYLQNSKENEEVSKDIEELYLPDEFQLNLENEDGNIEMYSFDIDKALENKRSVTKIENI